MKGSLYWFTGLAGAGKSTIAKIFYQDIKKTKNNIIFLDGDTLREVLVEKQKYSLTDRKKLAMKYSKFCMMIVEQEIDVVIATISMFHDVRDWNRENIKNYNEVYIKVPMDILIDRDQKNIYSKALSGEIKDVIGIDIDFEEPKNPDIIVLNNGLKSPEKIVEKILKQFKLRK